MPAHASSCQLMPAHATNAQSPVLNPKKINVLQNAYKKTCLLHRFEVALKSAAIQSCISTF